MRKLLPVLAVVTALALSGCDQADMTNLNGQNLVELLKQEQARFDALRGELETFHTIMRVQTAALILLGCGLAAALYGLRKVRKGAKGEHAP